MNRLADCQALFFCYSTSFFGQIHIKMYKAKKNYFNLLETKERFRKKDGLYNKINTFFSITYERENFLLEKQSQYGYCWKTSYLIILWLCKPLFHTWDLHCSWLIVLDLVERKKENCKSPNNLEKNEKKMHGCFASMHSCITCIHTIGLVINWHVLFSARERTPKN